MDREDEGRRRENKRLDSSQERNKSTGLTVMYVQKMYVMFSCRGNLVSKFEINQEDYIST